MVYTYLVFWAIYLEVEVVVVPSKLQAVVFSAKAAGELYSSIV